MRQLEIYFKHLSQEAQKEVLELYGLENEKDGNFETIPLFILECHPEDSESNTYEVPE